MSPLRHDYLVDAGWFELNALQWIMMAVPQSHEHIHPSPTYLVELYKKIKHISKSYKLQLPGKKIL